MFFFKNRNKVNHALKAPLEEIIERLKNIEESMSKLKDSPYIKTVNIRQLTVEKPNVEKLTFKLDKLDVEEVSGALNLGNNFGTRVNQQPDINEKKQEDINIHKHLMFEDSEEEQLNKDILNVRKTKAGYTFKVHTE